MAVALRPAVPLCCLGCKHVGDVLMWEMFMGCLWIGVRAQVVGMVWFLGFRERNSKD